MVACFAKVSGPAYLGTSNFSVPNTFLNQTVRQSFLRSPLMGIFRKIQGDINREFQFLSGRSDQHFTVFIVGSKFSFLFTKVIHGFSHFFQIIMAIIFSDI